MQLLLPAGGEGLEERKGGEGAEAGGTPSENPQLKEITPHPLQHRDTPHPSAPRHPLAPRGDRKGRDRGLLSRSQKAFTKRLCCGRFLWESGGWSNCGGWEGGAGALSAGFSLELKAVFKIGCLSENFSREETCHFGSARFLCWFSRQSLKYRVYTRRGER